MKKSIVLRLSLFVLFLAAFFVFAIETLVKEDFSVSAAAFAAVEPSPTQDANCQRLSTGAPVEPISLGLPPLQLKLVAFRPAEQTEPVMKSAVPIRVVTGPEQTFTSSVDGLEKIPGIGQMHAARQISLQAAEHSSIAPSTLARDHAPRVKVISAGPASGDDVHFSVVLSLLSNWLKFQPGSQPEQPVIPAV